MFMPDYAGLAVSALATTGKAIPPQAAKVRLGLKQATGSFLALEDLSLTAKGWTPVSGAAASFPGSLWTGTFSGVPAGHYGLGDLRIEILGADGQVLSSGLSATDATVDESQAAAASFFTIPASVADKSGTLAEGEMKFWKTSLSPYVAYDLTVSATGSGGMPDIVVFDDLGRLYSYSGSAGSATATHSLLYPRGGTYYIGVWADSGAVASYSLDLVKKSAGATKYPVTLAAMEEGFESSAFDRYAWLASGKVAPTISDSVFHEGTKSAAFVTSGLASGGISALSLDIKPSQASEIAFWLRTDTGSDSKVSVSFTFLVDGVVQGEWGGLDKPWSQVSFPVAAGQHTLEWRVLNKLGTRYTTSSNAVYVDQVTLLADQDSDIQLCPRGTLDFQAGMAGQRFEASARRSDGSIRSSATFTYSVETVDGGVGSIDASGLFVPTQAGTCRVKATSSDGFEVHSQLITIHPANWMRLPLAYMGGVYGGQSGAGTGNPATNPQTGIAISWPTTASFEADGFFTLEGTITMPSVFNYALVRVVKGTSTTEATSYFVRSAFSTRIWLRFGAGAYTVVVYKLASIDADLNGEGDYGALSYSSNPVYTFNVTNTRDEDGTFRYPSDEIQSDDFRIANIARDLTFGLVGTRDKIKAIHDYVVQTLYYDDASLTAGQRRKQDAISSLVNGTGVCEGYTSLTDALLRSAGIPAKAVSGRAVTATENIAHAWTNVLVDGTWLFLDSTWDDPYPLKGDSSIRYNYYLLASLTGVGGDHVPEDQRPGRATGSNPPSWRGYPDGWY